MARPNTSTAALDLAYTPRRRGTMPARSARRGQRPGGQVTVDRQPDEERRALAEPGLETDRATVAIDDRGARQRQALPGAATDVLGREERIEHAIADRLGDPGAGVRHGDQHGVGALAARADRDRAA